MEILALGLSWALNYTTSSQNILDSFGLSSLTDGDKAPWWQLSTQLSPKASVVLPNEPLFDNYTNRWRDWHAPDVGVVVNVYTESDIQVTVCSAKDSLLYP